MRNTSEAVEQPDPALADRRDMVYMGTHITAGRGEGVVAETGMRTGLGRIAGMIQTIEQEATPLQKRLVQLGKVLAAAALFIVLIIFVFG